MSRGKKLLALVLALAVLSGAALVATRLNPDNQETEEESVPLLSADASAATAISWTYNGETLSFEKSGEDWQYAADPDFPLDESYLENMLSALSSAAVTKTIEDAEDLSQYGLLDPARTITLTADATVTLLLGDETALDGDLYVSTGDGNVYLTGSSLLTSFDYGLLDLVEKEELPDLSDIAELSWGDCVAYNASDEALASYGLGENATLVTVTYGGTDEEDESDETAETAETETFTLAVGDATDSGYYAALPGSRMVYLVDADTVETLMSSAAEAE